MDRKETATETIPVIMRNKMIKKGREYSYRSKGMTADDNVRVCSETAEAGIIVRFQTTTTKASARVERFVVAHAYIVVVSFVVLF